MDQFGYLEGTGYMPYVVWVPIYSIQRMEYINGRNIAGLPPYAPFYRARDIDNDNVQTPDDSVAFTEMDTDDDSMRTWSENHEDIGTDDPTAGPLNISRDTEMSSESDRDIEDIKSKAIATLMPYAFNDIDSASESGGDIDDYNIETSSESGGDIYGTKVDTFSESVRDTSDLKVVTSIESVLEDVENIDIAALAPYAPKDLGTFTESVGEILTQESWRKVFAGIPPHQALRNPTPEPMFEKASRSENAKVANPSQAQSEVEDDIYGATPPPRAAMEDLNDPDYGGDRAQMDLDGESSLDDDEDDPFADITPPREDPDDEDFVPHAIKRAPRRKAPCLSH